MSAARLYTCANCKRRLPRGKLQWPRLVCKDRSGCTTAALAVIATFPAVKGPVTIA